MQHVTIPLDPQTAALTIPERMFQVMERNRLQGQPTTRNDFRQAAETSDLSDGELDANIGNAKRLIDPRTVRYDEPARPLSPLADAGYRKQVSDRMAADLVGLMPTRQVMVTLLMSRGLSKAELDACFDDAVREAGFRFARVG